jgi:mannose-6-phosphate isomerase-like protein (cupin superfamily)
MPGFTVVNLMELPDNIEFSEDIEGRFGRGALESRDLGISHWRYAPGYRSERGHKHGQQEEAYVVLSGSGSVVLDGEVRELSQWDTVRVAPEVVRAFAAGPDGLEFLAIGGPRPEEGDGEMGEAQWPEG